MKKIFTIFIVLLLVACVKYTRPAPEISTVNFDKNGGTTTILIFGNASFTENDTMNKYEHEIEYDDGMTKSSTMKCGWVTFKLQFYYDNNIHFGDPKLIITTEPNDTGKKRTFKLGLVNVMDMGDSRGEATITVTQEGE